MALFDLPLDQLRNRRSSSVEPADFDQFWTDTLGQARQYALDARFERVSTGLTTLDTYDVTFAGFGGHPVKGWFTLPAGTTEPLPVVVEFVGYGGGRGFAHTHLLWASALGTETAFVDNYLSMSDADRVEIAPAFDKRDIERLLATKLGDFQSLSWDEIWTINGQEAKFGFSKREGGEPSIGSISGEEGGDSWDGLDTHQSLIDRGWTLRAILPESFDIHELVPGMTYYDVAKQIVALHPDLKDKETFIRGLVKKYVHVEKHSVYGRLRHYADGNASEWFREILRLKVETHRDLARLSEEKLGNND